MGMLCGATVLLLLIAFNGAGVALLNMATYSLTLPLPTCNLLFGLAMAV